MLPPMRSPGPLVILTAVIVNACTFSSQAAKVSFTQEVVERPDFNGLHGVAQQAKKGDNPRFVWCSICPELTPKIPDQNEGISSSGQKGGRTTRTHETPAERILFRFDSATLDRQEEHKLRQLLEHLPPATKIELAGFTDSVGSKQYNDTLAMKRAEAVRDWLTANANHHLDIQIRAFGKCCYARQPGLRPENRRVEIYIRKGE